MSASALRGLLPLLIASLLWGVAFLPQSFSVAHLDALTACALRFALAAPVAIACVFLPTRQLPLLRRRQAKAPKSRGTRPELWPDDAEGESVWHVGPRGLSSSGVPLHVSLLLGALLYAAFILQTEALRHTPVARVSLITGLYAVFTPLLSPLFGLRRPGLLHLVGAIVALAGLAGLIGSFSAVRAPPNLGDLFTLLSALLSAIHMILVGKIAARAEPFALNALQLTTMAALAIPTALLFGAPLELGAIDTRTWLSLGYLAIFSSVAAFGLQLVGQRRASPSACAVVFLLESPIGALTAMLVLGEQLSASQLAGGGLLLLGVGLALFAEVRRG